ncbi:unnamed protein product [Blepharisma stoltei]|uniref:RRM domain-containing protein n=1 Tax=Blepharisma stoltei TaxID=1481888 RepID=A0AAU9J5F7_9CILI|nr:unnamed protein product [Blepharisma stoltei]
MGSQQSAFAVIANLVLGTNENENKEIDIKRLKELKYPANLEEAKRFRLNNSIVDKETDKKLYSVWSTSPESLGKYGVGLELYFLFLKQMIILFCIVAGLSIIPMVINSTGEFIREDESQNGSRYSLANSWSYDQDLLDLYIKNDTKSKNHSVIMNEKDINHILERTEEQYKWVWIADAVITSIFLLGLIVILIVNKIKIHDSELGNDRVSEYAIEVEGLPKENITEEEVKKHFERFGKVYETYLGRSYGDLLYLFKEKAEVKKEIRAQKIFLGISSSFCTDDRKMEKLRQKKTKLNERISILNLKKKHNEFDIYKAYIIFKTKEARKKALWEYRKGIFSSLSNKDPQLKFKNEFQLSVRSCTEPSDIMWENLEINRIEKKSRKCFSITITLIFMALSVGLIFLMRRKKLIDYDSYGCIHMNVDYDRKIWEIKQDKNMTAEMVLCWCRERSTDDWFNPAIFNECKKYALKRLSAGVVNFFICAGIVIVNYSLRLLLTTLSEFERHKSFNIKQTHTLLKIFFAMLFNTVLVPILTHIDWSGQSIGTEVTDQQFGDFEKLWYVKVGSIFSIMMCINVVSPHLIFNFLVLYMKGLYYRTKGYLKFKTQYEINNAFLGPVFVLSTRTSMILTVLFTCFIFSGGIPLLNIIALSALFTIYWTDKFLILRHYRKPPQYSHHIYSWTIKLMPLCALIHCCISLYAYGCPDVFPTGFVNNNYFDPLEMSIEDRIKMDHGKNF